MDTLVLIDGANMWYRAYCQAAKLGLDAPGGAVSIMSYMVKKPCEKYGMDNVVICWDAGKSGRDQIDTEYKGKRNAVPGVWEDIIYMYKMLACLGVSSAAKTGYEADDVIGSLARQASASVLILSYDKDFYQLVDDRIHVLRPGRTVQGNVIPEKIIKYNDVIEEFGCEPYKVVLFKAFRGDTSDNVPKLPIRFTKKFQKTFYEVLRISDNVDAFYANMNYFDKKYHEEFFSFKERALLNEKLILIQTDLDITVELNRLSSVDFNVLCEELEIKKLKLADWEKIPREAMPPIPIQRGLF